MGRRLQLTETKWLFAKSRPSRGPVHTAYLIAISLALALFQGCAGVASSPNSSQAKSTAITGTISVQPLSVTIAANDSQTFRAAVSGLSSTDVQWMVNGVLGGNTAFGTISTGGEYKAPAIDPGPAVMISAISVTDPQVSGSATVSIANPPTPILQGVSYSKSLASWNAVLVPWIENLAGLNWDARTRTWIPLPGWTAPAEGMGPSLYYLEQALRPATRMAIAKRDTALMEQLAEFHLAMLHLRTTTIGDMLNHAPPNAMIFIDGSSNQRTFAWYEPYEDTVRIRDAQQATAQYLSTAAQLLRSVAEMPAGGRTQTLNSFAQEFSGFIVSEQLLRLLYGQTAWSHYDNPNIPQPVVQAWRFLAVSAYRPPHPFAYQAAMTDTELWMISDAAEVLGADAAAPELNILDPTDRQQLQKAVLAGTTLMQSRCHHTTAPDGADVLSAFAGDYDDYPDYAYAAFTTPTVPTSPGQKYGLSWDISHSYRLPIVFRSLYETRSATGASFPARQDLVALANNYVHLAFNGDWQLPDFNNFLDGWDGWFRVGYSSIPGGYPPHKYCNAMQNPNNCLIAGGLQGWGQLAFANPDLATLSQAVVDLAFDSAPQDATFKDQHYFYNGHYNVSHDSYPQLLIYVVGDNAERLQ